MPDAVLLSARDVATIQERLDASPLFASLMMLSPLEAFEVVGLELKRSELEDVKAPASREAEQAREWVRQLAEGQTRLDTPQVLRAVKNRGVLAPPAPKKQSTRPADLSFTISRAVLDHGVRRFWEKNLAREEHTVPSRGWWTLDITVRSLALEFSAEGVTLRAELSGKLELDFWVKGTRYTWKTVVLLEVAVAPAFVVEDEQLSLRVPEGELTLMGLHFPATLTDELAELLSRLLPSIPLCPMPSAFALADTRTYGGATEPLLLESLSLGSDAVQVSFQLQTDLEAAPKLARDRYGNELPQGQAPQAPRGGATRSRMQPEDVPSEEAPAQRPTRQQIEEGLRVFGRNFTLRGRDLQGLDLSALSFYCTDLREIRGQGTNFHSCELRETKLSQAELTGANLQSADLTDATLEGATLDKADLRGATLNGVNLSEARLQQADLRGCITKELRLPKANLRAALMAGLDLGQQFRPELKGADLTGAVLAEADLSQARLTGANLTGADLRGADLRGARLESQSHFATKILRAPPADLTNALLHGANLEGAALSGVKLEGARYDRATRWPPGLDPSMGGAILEE